MIKEMITFRVWNKDWSTFREIKGDSYIIQGESDASYISIKKGLRQVAFFPENTWGYVEIIW